MTVDIFSYKKVVVCYINEGEPLWGIKYPNNNIYCTLPVGNIDDDITFIKGIIDEILK
mgnify:CR=1 FL=1